MKRFKKIYVEITNICNLDCSFCSKDTKVKKEMTIDEFKMVVSKIKEFTDYIYLHVKGEPLLHSKLDEILTVCDENLLKVNITTNGTFLKEKYEILNKHSCIRQINVSLHSENNKSGYFDDVFETCKLLSTKMFISYRLWTLKDNMLDKKSTMIVDKIVDSYNLSSNIVEKIGNDKSITIFNNTFVDKDNLFIWPSMDNDFEINAKCYGLITHIGILSDGTIIPCCLDSSGIIKLGNIFIDDLNTVLESDLVNNMIDSFKKNSSYCELCKHCNFRYRFTK